jgi:hypothetical protein
LDVSSNVSSDVSFEVSFGISFQASTECLESFPDLLAESLLGLVESLEASETPGPIRVLTVLTEFILLGGLGGFTGGTS